MKDSFSKQVITGITAVLLSIGLFVVAITIFNSSNRWLLYIVIALGLSTTLGSFLYIFGGNYLFLFGFKIGIFFSTFTILVQELPGIWRGLFIVTCAVILLAFPSVKEYLVKRERRSQSPKIKKIAEELKEQDELVQILESGKEQFLSSIAFGEKSLILRSTGGTFYQCIKGEDNFYFIKVGGEVRGLNFELIKTDFSDESSLITSKRDFLVSRYDISQIKFKADKNHGLSFDNSGSLTIFMPNGKKRFHIVDNISEDKVNLFFDGLNITMNSKPNESSNKPLAERDNGKRKGLLPKLELICTVLTVLSVLVSFSFLFLVVKYKVQSFLSIVLFLSIFALYVKYNDILSMADEKRFERTPKGKINISLLIFIPTFGLSLRSLIDFNIIDYKMLIFWSIGIYLSFVFVFFVLTKEYRTKKTSISLLLLVLLFFVPGAVIQTNYIFDTSYGTVVQSKVYDMKVSEGSTRSPDSYLIKVKLSNGNT